MFSYQSSHQMTTRNKVKVYEAFVKNGNKDPKKRARDGDQEDISNKTQCVSHEDPMEV
jgi:hypothetical protein